MRAAQNEQNHMSCQLHIFTSGFPTIQGLCSRPSLRKLVLWFVAYWRDLKDNLNISVTDREQRLSQNLPFIFGVTALCLNATGHKAWTQGDSPHPAHVIISIDSSPNVCLCTPPENPLAQGYNLLSTASKRINIFIVWAHMYIQTVEISA